MRTMPRQDVTAAKPHRCAFCGHAIDQGEVHAKFRAFDPDRRKAGSATWGASVEERWHIGCIRQSTDLYSKVIHDPQEAA